MRSAVLLVIIFPHARVISYRILCSAPIPRDEQWIWIFSDARDWCACLFAFYGLLRIKEYTCSGLLTQHVTVTHWGINLAIPFSKTSLIPTSVAIIRRDDALCPVLAFSAYSSPVPSHLRQPCLPFFLHSTSSATPLSDVTVYQQLPPLGSQLPPRVTRRLLRCDGVTVIISMSVDSGYVLRRGVLLLLCVVLRRQLALRL